ncbi:MAG: hypothetical protein ACRC3B_08980, partial [Bacteroidia bacterium]
RNENGTETMVDVLLEKKLAGEEARIYYRRNGNGVTTPQDLPGNSLSDSNGTEGFILWSWNATVFDGHEDETKKTGQAS